MTAEGDVLYGGSSGTVTKLAKGSDADVLTLASGIPSWATPTTGDITGVTAGVGLSGGGSSGSVTLTLDLSELSTVTPADGDFFSTLDSDGANEQKTTTTALATLFAGTNLTASSSVISVDDSFVTNTGNDTMMGILTISNSTTSTSTSSGALKVSGGVGIAENLHVGGDVMTKAAGNANFAKQNSTVTGLYAVGAADGVLLTDGQYFTFEFGNGGMFVIDDNRGSAGVFGTGYESSTMVAISDPGSAYDVTDTGSKIAVFTGTNDATVTIKNRTGSNQTLRVVCVGNLVSATAVAP